MSDDLDLDINNYDISQLEKFFRLPSEYNEHNITQNESDIRRVLLSSGHIASHLKHGLISFLEEGKKRLISAKIKVRNPTTIKPKISDESLPNFPIPNISPPSRAENILRPKETPFIYTQPSEYFPGILNPLDNRTLQKCVSIDSRFRPSTNMNSDFIITLPNRIPKVLSLECASFEIDRNSLYNISSSLGNNYFYVKITVDVSGVETDYTHVIIVPDGHYDSDLLINTLNRFCSSKKTTPFFYLQWEKDSFGSGKCVLLINTNDVGIKNISLDFTLDNAGNEDKTHDSFSKMGYVLGFTKRNYSNITEQCMSEIPIRMNASLPYFYLSIDDFQNRSIACFQPAFSQITMSPSILARISLREQEPVEILSTPRKYFGPIDMSRLHIRLLDPYGKVLQMDANFSFCLLLHTVYDI